MKVKIKDILEYIVLILCVLNCNTVYSTCETMNFRLPELIILSLILYLCFDVKKIKKQTILKWTMIFLPYYVLNILLVIISVGENRIIAFIVRFCLFIPLLTLVLMNNSSRGKKWDLLLKFKNLIVVYALISIVFWIGVSYLHIIPQTGSILCQWGTDYNYPLYFGLYTVRQHQILFGIEWIRNIGFFTEGPMYNVVLIIALSIEMFVEPIINGKNKSFWDGIDIKKMMVLVLADISTFTVTGMISMVGMFAMKYCLLRNRTKTGKMIKWLLGIIVLIISLFVIESLLAVKYGGGSWKVRADDLRAGYLTWKESKLFGTGYDSMEAIIRNMSSYRFYNMGYSSGLFTILAQGGLAWFAIYVISFWGYIKYSFQNGRFEILAMLITYIIILIVSIFQNSFLMMFILAYGFLLLSEGKRNQDMLA